MYWSKYNIVFESPYGRFIYNTFTNNLMEMNASLISCIDKIISGDFSYLSEDDVLALKKNMILVDDDTNIYRSIKLQRLMSRLDTGYLTLTIAPTVKEVVHIKEYIKKIVKKVFAKLNEKAL